MAAEKRFIPFEFSKRIFCDILSQVLVTFRGPSVVASRLQKTPYGPGLLADYETEGYKFESCGVYFSKAFLAKTLAIHAQHRLRAERFHFPPLIPPLTI